MHKNQKVTIIIVIVLVVALAGILLTIGLINMNSQITETSGSSAGVSVFSSDPTDTEEGSEFSNAGNGSGNETAGSKVTKDPSGSKPTKPTREDPRQSGRRTEPTHTKSTKETTRSTERPTNKTKETVKATPVATLSPVTNTPKPSITPYTSESHDWELPRV